MTCSGCATLALDALASPLGLPQGPTSIALRVRFTSQSINSSSRRSRDGETYQEPWSGSLPPWASRRCSDRASWEEKVSAQMWHLPISASLSCVSSSIIADLLGASIGLQVRKLPCTREPQVIASHSPTAGVGVNIIPSARPVKRAEPGWDAAVHLCILTLVS